MSAIRRVSTIGVFAAMVLVPGYADAVGATPADAPWLVVSVADGDTFDVARGPVVLTVRLIGINAPESDDCWAAEATTALIDAVGDGPVWLVIDHSDVDRYGRALRYVLDRDGSDVGAQLVEQGAAIARSYPPDTANDDRYALLQEDARVHGRGLWAPDACGPLGGVVELLGVTPSIGIEVMANADGDDNLNLNGEWVRLTNTGVAPLDLTAWIVRDESSSHRYRFDDLTLDVGASVTLYTGCGVDTATERFWCNEGSAIWNNSGDTVFLLDPAGNVVSQLGY